MFQVNKLFSSRLYINLALGLLISAIATIVIANPTHAASFTVAAGNDENTDNASCALSEAIENINDQATTNTDCSPTGAYGTDDAINLPAGTITLTADLPSINEAVTFSGEGMGESIIDGDNGQYVGVFFNTPDEVTVEGFTVRAFRALGVIVLNANLSASNVEVDGTGSVASDLPFTAGSVILAGFRYSTSTSVNSSISVDNIHVHDFNTSTSVYTAGIVLEDTNSSTISNFLLQNSTVNDIHSTSLSNPQVHAVSIGSAPGTVIANGPTVKNVTIDAISSATSTIFSGISYSTFSFDQGDYDSNLFVHNVTMNDIIATATQADLAAPLLVVGGVQESNETVVSAIHAQNLLITNSSTEGEDRGCQVYDANAFIGGAGTFTGDIVSSGGNLSDNTSCNTYFTQPTDQNNVVGLAATFGPLGDYGGYVPTIPLLEGSPAIDAGVTLAGLASDARGVSRPLGVAYDSGAYESPFTKTTESVDTLADTGGSVRMLLVTASTLLAGSMLATWQKRVLQ